MASDEITAFYWRHRERIEEWAALAPAARNAWCESLDLAAAAQVGRQPAWEFVDGLFSQGWHGIRLPLDEGRGIHVGVFWVPGDASPTGYGYWPEIAVSVPAGRGAWPGYDDVKNHLTASAARWGMSRNRKGHLLLLGLAPRRSDLTMEESAAATLETVRAAHAELQPETTAYFLGS